MLDSGTTDHFLSIRAGVYNIRPTKNQVNVTIPDGATLQSSHECDINWPDLPKEARTGHILPGLANQSLIPVVKLYNAGCIVIFHKLCCTILYNNKIILYGIKCPTTKLWLVPLKQSNGTKPTSKTQQHHINSIYQTNSQTELIKYLHQCFISPPKLTLIKAMKNDQLLCVPGLTKEAANKYLPTSTATIKGHMHREQKKLTIYKETRPSCTGSRPISQTRNQRSLQIILFFSFSKLH